MLGTTIGAMDGIILGTYNGLDIWWLERSTDGTKDDNVDGFLLRIRFGFIYTLELSKNECAKVSFPVGKILGTKLVSMYGLDLGAFNNKEIGSLEGLTYGSKDGKIWALLMGLKMAS